MMLLLVIAASFVLASKLNAAATNYYRDDFDARVLAEAKVTLIARAELDDNRPGSLPCPDTNGDGSAELFVGNECPSYIGRLPWRTLNSNDLRDSAGETLWYGLSRNFRDDNSAQPINSDTAGTLTLDGGPTQMVAVLIAPGPSLANPPVINQVRPTNNVVDYLEAGNVDGDNDFVSRAAGQFNDQIIVISRAELMSGVEKRVLGEAQAELRQFAIANGYFPFVSQAGPSYFPQVSNCGDGAGGNDLLPLTDAPSGELAVQNIPVGDWYRTNGWADRVQYHVGRASSRYPATPCAGSPAGETTVNLNLNGQIRTLVP
jgi:hypothetical protein